MRGDQIEPAARLLAHSPIFQGAAPDELRRFLSGPGSVLRTFARGELICQPGVRSGGLGMLVEGRAQVRKGDESHPVLMNILHKGELFGAVTLYGTNDSYFTRVTAHTACTALILSRDLVDRMLLQNPRFARQYIAYLSDRIHFLNGRIDAFTGGTSESRLAAYLLANLIQDETGAAVRLQGSMSQLTQSLNIARASLYRAFEQLEEAGAVRRDGRRVEVLDVRQLQDCCGERECGAAAD